MGYSMWMFNVIPLLVTLGFCFVIVYMIVTLIKNGIQWSKNNASPVLTVEAKVVAKRQHTSYHNNANSLAVNSSSTYYATFEMESGDRMELKVSGSEYGMLVEGDSGKLTFQGTRYKGFVRH